MTPSPHSRKKIAPVVPEPSPHGTVAEIDALFETAGLVRSLRGKSAGITRRLRLQRFTAEELAQPAPDPVIALNGVQILQVPAWRTQASWLWHGFSTRKGGLSRAYCAEDAEGDLNLGFTVADDRETVLRNRRLLIEAVSGDARTPLITLRQIHSSVLVHP